MYNILEKHRFDEIYRIMEENFPPDERRTYEQQKEILNDERYKIYTVEENGIIKAFFAIWILNGFVFAEHLAVDSRFHNGGIGTKLLMEVVNSLKAPVVLEIEPENFSDMAKRRAGFYKRLGFNINQYEYEQPSYGEGKNSIPMYLVSYPEKLSENDFLEYKKIIYREIYNRGY